MPQEMLSIVDVARIVGVSKDTVKRLVKIGSMPAPRRIGRRLLRWHPDDIRQWMDDGCPRVVESDGVGELVGEPVQAWPSEGLGKGPEPLNIQTRGASRSSRG